MQLKDIWLFLGPHTEAIKVLHVATVVVVIVADVERGEGRKNNVWPELM